MSAREITGQTVFEECMRERLLNDIRGWDRREYEEVYNGSTWKCVSPGLKPVEKAKWERVAAAIRALATRPRDEGEEG